MKYFCNFSWNQFDIDIFDFVFYLKFLMKVKLKQQKLSRREMKGKKREKMIKIGLPFSLQVEDNCQKFWHFFNLKFFLVNGIIIVELHGVEIT